MHLTAQARYDAAVPDVAQMFADEVFVAAKVRASGALSHQVDVVGRSEDAFTVTTRRQMPTTDIPAQFRSFLGATLEVRQVEAWEAPDTSSQARTGTVVVEITGAPVRMSGTLLLEPDGEGALLTVAGELKASVPLFAQAVEEATAGAVRAAFAAEEQVGREYLRSR